MGARITPEMERGICAGIRAGKLAKIIALETGVSESSVRKIAVQYGLIFISRRGPNKKPGAYWRKYLRTRVNNAPDPKSDPEVVNWAAVSASLRW